MCMEDIRIGRMAESKASSVNVGTTAVRLVSRDLRRVALIICPSNAGRVTLGQSPTPVIDQGPTLFAAAAPLVLNVQHHGRAVTDEWYAVAANADSHTGIIEVYLPQDPQQKERG